MFKTLPALVITSIIGAISLFIYYKLNIRKDLAEEALPLILVMIFAFFRFVPKRWVEWFFDDGR